jgi:ankyrin repeat protein
MTSEYYKKYHDSTPKRLGMTLTSACRAGDLELAKYVLTSPELDNHADIHSIEDVGFDWACFNGHLDLVKYLVASPDLKENISVSANDYGGLNSACLSGYLDVVQFLFEFIDPKLPNIADIYTDACANAATNKHYHVISFLVIDKDMQRTEELNEWLKKHPDENVEKIFALRDLNKNLNNELVVDEHLNNTKRMKL